MGHGRTEPLNAGEAKAALLDWGRAADRALGRRIAARRWVILGGAVAAGVLISLVGPGKSRRGRAKSGCGKRS